MGVNDRVALAKASRLMNARINEAHMRNGVTFVDPSNTYIESDVVIGHDTLIEPGVILRGKTVIGDNCYISTNSDIKDSVLGNHVKVHSSNIKESTIRDGADVGPYAHIRPNSEIHENAHIGNFVEIKKATIGKESKVGHLTYVGDATLGKDINVGCGTVFVNYDGKNKFHTTIGDHSFIGSGTNLVGPVTLGRNSATAAGSTITEDVPEDALGIARGRQSNLEGYAKKMPYNE